MSCFRASSVLPHVICGPSGVMTVLVLVSVGFTVSAIGTDAADVPPVCSLADCGQSAAFAEAEGAADLPDAVDSPDEQAVAPRPRSAIPAITPSVLRAVIATPSLNGERISTWR